MSLMGPTVFIVTGDAGLRVRLTRVVGEYIRAMVFASACEYFAARQLDGPACVIADLHLPEMTGLDFQRRIAPTCRPIIFWARHADLASAVHAIKAGAVDVLTPSSTDHDLQCAVQMALDQDEAVRLTAHRLGSLRRRFANLTPRERAVLQLIASGMLNKQVALQLSLKEVTVKVHRGRIMRKMRAHSFADLVRMAADLELPIVQADRSGRIRTSVLACPLPYEFRRSRARLTPRDRQSNSC